MCTTLSIPSFLLSIRTKCTLWYNHKHACSFHQKQDLINRNFPIFTKKKKIEPFKYERTATFYLWRLPKLLVGVLVAMEIEIVGAERGRRRTVRIWSCTSLRSDSRTKGAAFCMNFIFRLISIYCDEIS